jgi:hypothetical protein
MNATKQKQVDDESSMMDAAQQKQQNKSSLTNATKAA